MSLRNAFIILPLFALVLTGCGLFDWYQSVRSIPMRPSTEPPPLLKSEVNTSEEPQVFDYLVESSTDESGTINVRFYGPDPRNRPALWYDHIIEATGPTITLEGNPITLGSYGIVYAGTHGYAGRRYDDRWNATAPVARYPSTWL